MTESEPVENSGDCIKIFLRVRPSFSDHNRTCLQVNSDTGITLKGQNPKIFEFDYVADEHTTQETVFSCVGRQTVESCVEGYNGTIFAYGQTGSGKTHTMLGPGDDNIGNCEHHLRGLIPRSLEYLFELIERKQELHGKQFEFECKASFLEIYNEQIYDLLDQYSSRPLQLRESTNRGVFIEGITECCVASSHEACKVLAEGWGFRRVASTSMNRESSRSHAVFTLTVELKEQTASGIKIRQSVLNLVDLAGSERQRDTQASGIQLREAGKINGSLSVLAQVITALDDIAHNKTRHVPYRNSKLTFLLRDSLGGNAKTHIIVNVHPNMQYFSETTSTLLFAQSAKQIKNKARVNENLQGDVAQLQNEIRRLKAELLSYEQGSTSQLKTQKQHNAENENFSMQGDHEYRDKFFQAMQMLKKQEEVTSSLKKQIAKMDKVNLSKQFIIKLRNSTINKLKNGKNITKDEEVMALQKEIETLKQQVEHHPEIASLQTKITELQCEVHRLQDALGKEASLEREKSLQDLFVQLAKELDSSDYSDSTLIPVAVNESGISEVVELKEELRIKSQELEKMNSQNSSLQADLSSLKQNVEELETVLKKTREESTIHMKNLNEMHSSTLRTIMTPTKGRFAVGDGDGPSPAKRANLGPVPVENLIDISFPEEEVLDNVPHLLDQSMPQLMEDVLHEALQEELRQVKDQMETFREECLSKNQELTSLRQAEEVARGRLTQCMESLTALKEEHNKLLKDMDAITSDKQLADEEVRDLKILLNAADREHKEAKKKYEATVESLNKRISEKECSFFALQERYGKMEDDKEKAIIEARDMSADCERQRIELNFLRQQISELTSSLDHEKKKCEDANLQLQDTGEALKRELANSTALQCQLEGKTKEISEELSSFRTRNAELEKSASALQEEYNLCISKLQEKDAELNEMKNRKMEADAAIQALRVQVSELRGTNSMLEIANGGLHAEFDELMGKFNKTVADLDKGSERVVELEEILKRCKEEFKVKQEKYDFELESLQEDLLGYAEEYEALDKSWKSDLTKLENEKQKTCKLEGELQKLQVLEKLTKERENRLDEISTKYRSCQERLTQLEEKLNEAEKVRCDLLQAHSFEMAEMNEKWAEQNAEVVKNLQQELEEAKSKEKNSTAHADSLCGQLKKNTKRLEETEQEVKNLKESEEALRQDALQAKTQLEKLSEDAKPMQMEMDEARQLRSLAEKELEETKQENKKLLGEIAVLAGHANHQQKIQYLKKLKDKMLSAETENTRLKVDLRKMETKLLKYERNSKSEQMSGGTKPNVKPLAERDINGD